MVASLDGERVFDSESRFEVGSVVRDKMERAVAGLDGVLSIDLGVRGREIRQRGTICAASRVGLRVKKEKISDFLDGEVHVLCTGEGEVFEDVRMDGFEAGVERASGSGVECDYEVVYRQLRV